ncbi:Vesicle-associated membrane protein 713 [Hirschfeldia incana]|nr:Vesicle-associated membrane protein 713 [Hirschfeldia incana]
MAILYALVARGSVVLSEFSATSTNASSIAKQILEKLPGEDVDSHVSYSQDRYVFHVKRTDGLTVLCMADETAGRSIPFGFLEEIHQRFVRTYGRGIHSAQAYSMNDEFSRVLSQQMEYYSNDPNADRVSRIKVEMSQVRNVMIENIDKVLDRGERLELLVDKTANMQGNTFRFRKQARRFRSVMWWRNVKLTIALILILAVVVYIAMAFVCHGPSLPSCFK